MQRISAPVHSPGGSDWEAQSWPIVCSNATNDLIEDSKDEANGVLPSSFSKEHSPRATFLLRSGPSGCAKNSRCYRWLKSRLKTKVLHAAPQKSTMHGFRCSQTLEWPTSVFFGRPRQIFPLDVLSHCDHLPMYCAWPLSLPYSPDVTRAFVLIRLIRSWMYWRWSAVKNATSMVQSRINRASLRFRARIGRFVFR